MKNCGEKYTTLISDFDNTLFDWFSMWYQSFSVMLRQVEKISGIDEQILISEIREIHQRYGTSEYAFLLEELPSLSKLYPPDVILEVFDEAIHAYRSARKNSLKMYDGVVETLEALRAENTLIVLYTESLAFYTNFRIRRLGLDGLVDIVFSPPDHALPDGKVSHADVEEANLQCTKHLYLPDRALKPNPDILLEIIRKIDRRPSECVYLGDSKMKDIAMAQSAGVFDVWAEYGAHHSDEEYELLRKVSHWTESDVIREKQLRKKDVIPSATISNFPEMLNIFGVDDAS